MNSHAHDHCESSSANNSDEHAHCAPKNKLDILLWGSLFLIIVLYALGMLFPDIAATNKTLNTLSISVIEIMHTIWWGILIGLVMVSLLTVIPREFVMSVLGKGGTISGLMRATAGGVLLDLCSHGILMVAAKLYERGASAGQMVAFLIASPWNSFSLTLILIALIGLKWTLLFILFSLVIAFITGFIFDALVRKGILPENPNQVEHNGEFRFFPEAKQQFKAATFNAAFYKKMFWDGLTESRMVLRWIFFGVILAAAVRALVPMDVFANWFGPTLAGLGLTLVAATIMEVCSEGSVPVAADFLTRANAPGNSFAFLMGGVATDYTEIMIIKETTKSWKFALFLPLISLPQVIVLAAMINSIA
jgi:uncharacterized membrane protein YraQ (UPF0718 family)